MVKEGSIDNSIFNTSDELEYIHSYPANVIDTVNKEIKKHIDLGYSLDEDIQVLAPMYKGVAGIDAINKSISDEYNLNYSYVVETKEKVFKENDKVIQLQNSSELQILNGDVGKLKGQSLMEIDGKDKTLYDVDFVEKRVKLTVKDFDNLNLAYAVSVHKSQGSEYNIVILTLLKSYSIMFVMAGELGAPCGRASLK